MSAALIYGLMMIYATGAGLWAIGGKLNDYGNKYPLPLGASALVVGGLAQLLP